jgi:hypothetical protein
MSSIGIERGESKGNIPFLQSEQHSIFHPMMNSAYIESIDGNMMKQNQLKSGQLNCEMLLRSPQVHANHSIENLKFRRYKSRNLRGESLEAAAFEKLPKITSVGQNGAVDLPDFISPILSSLVNKKSSKLFELTEFPKFSAFVTTPLALTKSKREMFGSAQTMISTKKGFELSKLSGKELLDFCESSEKSFATFGAYVRRLNFTELVEVTKKIEGSFESAFNANPSTTRVFIILSNLNLGFMTYLGNFCKSRIGKLLIQPESYDILLHLIDKNPFFRAFMINYLKDRFNIFENDQVSKTILVACVKGSTKYQQFTIHKHLLTWLQKQPVRHRTHLTSEVFYLLSTYSSDSMISQIGKIFVQRTTIREVLDYKKMMSALSALILRRDKHATDALTEAISNDLVKLLENPCFYSLMARLMKVNQPSDLIGQIKTALIRYPVDLLQKLGTSEEMVEKYAAVVILCVRSTEDLIRLKSRFAILNRCPGILRCLADSSLIHGRIEDIEFKDNTSDD